MDLKQQEAIQEKMGCLLWESAKEREDSAWAEQWRSLWAEECFSLSGIGPLKFGLLWPVRKLGDREELFWQELESLERLKRIAPDCAERIITEMTGSYLLIRGLQYFSIELYRKRIKERGKQQADILCVNESPEEAACLNFQEMRLADGLRQLGIAFTNEDYLWQFLQCHHPQHDDSLYYWREFGRLWKLLAGRELRPDLSDQYVCGHLAAVLNPEHRMEEHEQQVVYALKETGAFRNADHKSTSLRNAIQRIEKEDTPLFRMLLKKGFFSKRELREKVRNHDTPDWMLPILIMANHGCDIFAPEEKTAEDLSVRSSIPQTDGSLCGSFDETDWGLCCSFNAW